MAEADITATTSGGDRNWSTAATWVGGVKPATDQHAIIPSGAAVTLDGNEEIASLVVNNGGTITGNASYSLTINSEGNATYGAHYQSVQISGAIGTNLNLILTYSGSSEYETGSTSGRVHNLTISSDQVFWENGVSLAGNLVVDAGKIFRAYTKSKALTVDGDVTCNGTIDCRGISEGGDPIGDMAVSCRSLRIGGSGTYHATGATTTITGVVSTGYVGMRVDNGATLHNNDGTFQFDNSGETWIQTSVDNLDVVFHHLIINGNIYISKSDIHCEGNLIINASKSLRPYNQHNNLTVDGNVTVSGTLGKDAWGLGEPTRAACSFGSLTINSGGTYIATQNTTIITGIASTWSLETVSGGTFKHNKGTVLFNSGSDQKIKLLGTGDFYNLTINKSDNDMVQGSTGMTILNNFDITMAADHTWRTNTTSYTLTVLGNLYLRAGRIGDTTQYDGVINWGNVTITSGEFVLSSGTNNFTGIRNIGGTISQS